jgi:glucose-6-phosphate isomerase
VNLRRRDLLTAGDAAASALQQSACGGKQPAARTAATLDEPGDTGDLAFDFSRAAPALNAHSLGQLFYFFECACFVSGTMLGVNPFDQPGVEAYKTNMFAALGKS